MTIRFGLLWVLVLPSALAAAAGAAPAPTYDWQLPAGFPVPAVPADNPMSAAKVALGRRLFFDPRLSMTGTVSCASCHNPARAYTDGRPRALGALGEELPRGAMSLTNVVYNASFGWTARRVASLEAQMRQPLFNQHPVEMGLAGREADVTALLGADERYTAAFRRAFPRAADPVSLDNAIRAIASFERTLISGNSAFDRYVFRGEHAALSEPAKRGLGLFYSKRLGCANCHGGFNFTGTWTERDRPVAPAAFARDGRAGPAVRVPTLRNVALTAPYMHDGRYATLEEVIRHYERDGAGMAEEPQDPSSPASRPVRRLTAFRLNARERADLVAFLNALTDDEFVATREPGRAAQSLTDGMIAASGPTPRAAERAAN
jgi:cytochrome c peroxidase